MATVSSREILFARPRLLTLVLACKLLGRALIENWKSLELTGSKIVWKKWLTLDCRVPNRYRVWPYRSGLCNSQQHRLECNHHSPLTSSFLYLSKSRPKIQIFCFTYVMFREKYDFLWFERTQMNVTLRNGNRNWNVLSKESILHIYWVSLSPFRKLIALYKEKIIYEIFYIGNFIRIALIDSNYNASRKNTQRAWVQPIVADANSRYSWLCLFVYVCLYNNILDELHKDIRTNTEQISMWSFHFPCLYVQNIARSNFTLES